MFESIFLLGGMTPILIQPTCVATLQSRQFSSFYEKLNTGIPGVHDVHCREHVLGNGSFLIRGQTSPSRCRCFRPPIAQEEYASGNVTGNANVSGRGTIVHFDMPIKR
uniref:Uncharacterized protein n=1 Tax=Cacopsylla melanoneura TaxID=428564 RepID=A0A8D8YEI1_9HEMI